MAEVSVAKSGFEVREVKVIVPASLTDEELRAIVAKALSEHFGTHYDIING